jgi:hypothetical protein
MYIDHQIKLKLQGRKNTMAHFGKPYKTGRDTILTTEIAQQKRSRTAAEGD